MGAGIAQVFAQSGCLVTLIDIDRSVLKQAQERIKPSINAFKETGLYSQRKTTAALAKINITTKLAEEIKSADFIMGASRRTLI